MSEFFKFTSNGKEFNFEQFKSKLEDSDTQKNEKLKKLFNIFDTDGSGKLEETNSKGEKELEFLFNSIKNTANSNGDDILEGNELEMFINSVSPDLKEEEKKEISESFKSLFTKEEKATISQNEGTSV